MTTRGFAIRPDERPEAAAQFERAARTIRPEDGSPAYWFGAGVVEQVHLCRFFTKETDAAREAVVQTLDKLHDVMDAYASSLRKAAGVAQSPDFAQVRSQR